MRHAGHEPAPGGSRAGRSSRSPWGPADGPGRMAPRQGPRRARQPHAGAAARPSARIEPGREYLAVSARELVVEPRVRLLPRHRRSLLRRVEQAHRPALAHHVHRPPGLGQCMMLSAGWDNDIYLADQSNVRVAWYKFIDQPALQNLKLTADQKNQLQSRVELLHKKWNINGNFMKKPSVGALVSVDPKLIVTPPKGYEAGYVPIVVAQSPQERD